MNLKGDGRLAAKHAPPPAREQALVEHGVHRDDRLGARPVGPVGLYTKADVGAPAPGK